MNAKLTFQRAAAARLPARADALRLSHALLLPLRAMDGLIGYPAMKPAPRLIGVKSNGCVMPFPRPY